MGCQRCHQAGRPYRSFIIIKASTKEAQTHNTAKSLISARPFFQVFCEAEKTQSKGAQILTLLVISVLH